MDFGLNNMTSHLPLMDVVRDMGGSILLERSQNLSPYIIMDRKLEMN
jgi:hypothetical protein